MFSFSSLKTAVYHYMGYKPLFTDEDHSQVVDVGESSKASKLYSGQESSVDDMTRYYKNVYWADLHSKEEEVRKDKLRQANLYKKLERKFSNMPKTTRNVSDFQMRTQYIRYLTNYEPTTANCLPGTRYVCFMCKDCNNDIQQRKWFWKNGKDWQGNDFMESDAFKIVLGNVDELMG